MRPDLSYALRFSATKTYQITCLASCVYIVKDLSRKWRGGVAEPPLKREEIRRTLQTSSIGGKENNSRSHPSREEKARAGGEGTPSKAGQQVGEEANKAARRAGGHVDAMRGRGVDVVTTPAARRPPGPHRHGPAAAAAMRLKPPLRASRPPGPPLAKPPSPPTPLIRPPFVS